MISKLSNKNKISKEERKHREEGDSPRLFGSSSPWTLDKVAFYAFLFLMPIFFLPVTLSPVMLNKQLFAGVILLGLFVYALSRFLASGRINLPNKMALGTVTALFSVVLLSAVFSIERSVSFISFSVDSIFWVGMYILAFLLAVNILRDRASVVMSFVSLSAGIGALSIFSLIQFSGIYIFPFDFAQSVTFNPVGTVFAVGFIVAAGMAAILGYVALANPKNRLIKYIIWALASIYVLLVFQINLMSIWISLAIAFVVISIVVGMDKMKGAKASTLDLRPLLIPFFVIIIALLAVFINPVIPSFINVPAEIGPTFSGTLDIVKGSLDGVRALYGTGPGTFPYDFAQHRPLEINQTNFWGVQFDQGQSVFLTHLATWGLLGSLALLSTLSVFIFTLFKGVLGKKSTRDDSLRGIILGSLGIVVLLAVSIFIYRGNVVMYTMLFSAAGIGTAGIFVLSPEKSKELNTAESPRAMLFSSLAAIVLVSFSLGGFYFLGQKYVADVYLAKGVNEFTNSQDLESALGYLNSAIRTNPKNERALRITAQALSLRLTNIATNDDIQQEQANQLFRQTLQSAVSIATEATTVNPHNVQNWTQLGRLYEQVIGIASGAEQLAVDAYGDALKFDPKNPSLPLAQARAYIAGADASQSLLANLNQIEDVDREKLQEELIIQRKDYLDKAIERINFSIELKSNYSEARFLLANAYSRLGELDKAIEETETVAELNPSDPNVAFQLGLLYYQDESYNLAKDALEYSLTLANGEFANARYYLGLAYFELGDRQLAIEQFETLEKDNPDNMLITRILNNLVNGRDPLVEVQEPQSEPPVSDDGGAGEPVIGE
ncbi:MAG: tetratricopeptide repeat protein [Candidatus Spechtbacterales bacterium]|nr:tetratricopeptide repeat protein [Candidatus Spechtbacterales bacterium]